MDYSVFLLLPVPFNIKKYPYISPVTLLSLTPSLSDNNTIVIRLLLVGVCIVEQNWCWINHNSYGEGSRKESQSLCYV